MAEPQTALVFPNTGERDRAFALLQEAGLPVAVFEVPSGVAGVEIAAVRFATAQEPAVRHLLGRHHVMIGGTGRLGPDKAQGSALAATPSATHGDSLLQRVQLTMILPCIADYRKIRVRAALSDDISAVLPYLNALLPRAVYNPHGQTLTFTQGERMVTLYPMRVEMAKADDVLDALRVLAWLWEWVNETWANRESLSPSFERLARPHALQLYPYLPAARRNCRRCGEPTCLALAVKVVNEIEGRTIGDCVPLRGEEYAEQRDIAYALLRTAGYPVPADDRQG